MDTRTAYAIEQSVQLDSIIQKYRELSQLQSDLNVEDCLPLVESTKVELKDVKNRIATMKRKLDCDDFPLALIRHMCGEKRYDTANFAKLDINIRNIKNPKALFSKPLTIGKDVDNRRFVVLKTSGKKTYFHLFYEETRMTPPHWIFYPNMNKSFSAIVIKGDDLVGVDKYLEMQSIIRKG